MSVASNIQAWRSSRQLSVETVADRCQITPSVLGEIENGIRDPSAGMLTALAKVFGIPPAWLYGDPRDLQFLTQHLEEGELTDASRQSLDPVVACVLQSIPQDRTLFTLLTVLLQSGDEKLIRTTEVSLRSLAKQVKPTGVPWQSRQSGHFEPASD